jgi:hypothetical protein
MREMTAGKYRVLLGALYRAGTARRGGGEEVRRLPVVERLKLHRLPGEGRTSGRGNRGGG